MRGEPRVDTSDLFFVTGRLCELRAALLRERDRPGAVVVGRPAGLREIEMELAERRGIGRLLGEHRGRVGQVLYRLRIGLLLELRLAQVALGKCGRGIFHAQRLRLDGQRLAQFEHRFFWLVLGDQHAAHVAPIAGDARVVGAERLLVDREAVPERRERLCVLSQRAKNSTEVVIGVADIRVLQPLDLLEDLDAAAQLRQSLRPGAHPQIDHAHAGARAARVQALLAAGLLLDLESALVLGERLGQPIERPENVGQVDVVLRHFGMIFAERLAMVVEAEAQLLERFFVVAFIGQDERRRVTPEHWFKSPADISGTATLLVEHADRDDDLWVYLPALKKVRRLSASNKKDSFVGTDFTYGDMIGYRVDEWTHRLLREEAIDGVACWVVESVPKSDAVKSDTGYARRQTWVRKDNYAAAQIEVWDLGGQILKRMSFTELKSVGSGGKWTPMHMKAENLQTGHKTLIDVTQFEADKGLDDRFFTTRYLEQ